eukprot:544919-Lingulodinium_polyedra.AAC.1
MGAGGSFERRSFFCMTQASPSVLRARNKQVFAQPSWLQIAGPLERSGFAQLGRHGGRRAPAEPRLFVWHARGRMAPA